MSLLGQKCPDPPHLTRILQPKASGSNESLHITPNWNYHADRQFSSHWQWQDQDQVPHNESPSSYVHTSHYGRTNHWHPAGQDGSRHFNAQAQASISATSPQNMSPRDPSTSSFPPPADPSSGSSPVVCTCGYAHSGGTENLIMCRICRRSFHKVCCHISNKFPERWTCWECILVC